MSASTKPPFCPAWDLRPRTGAHTPRLLTPGWIVVFPSSGWKVASVIVSVGVVVFRPTKCRTLTSVWCMSRYRTGSFVAKGARAEGKLPVAICIIRGRTHYGRRCSRHGAHQSLPMRYRTREITSPPEDVPAKGLFAAGRERLEKCPFLWERQESPLVNWNFYLHSRRIAAMEDHLTFLSGNSSTVPSRGITAANINLTRHYMCTVLLALEIKLSKVRHIFFFVLWLKHS